MDIPNGTFNKVCSWMKRHKEEFDNATNLAESAADEWCLYEDNEDYTIPEWVFEVAAKVKPTI